MSSRIERFPAPLAVVASRLGWTALNAAQFAFTLAWTAAWISLALALRAIAGTRWPLRMAARCWSPGLLLGAGARLRVEGAESVDWSRPYVLVANHQSVIDICALFGAVPVPLRFMLKQELARVPFLGWYARAMGMVFVARGSRRGAADSLRHATALVGDGASLCVFAEGTRSRDGALGRFKSGAFQVAAAAGAAVLPVAISGSGAVLPGAGFRVRPGPILVRFGTPLPAPAANTAAARERLAQAAREAVAGLLHGPAP